MKEVTFNSLREIIFDRTPASTVKIAETMLQNAFDKNINVFTTSPDFNEGNFLHYVITYYGQNTVDPELLKAVIKKVVVLNPNCITNRYCNMLPIELAVSENSSAAVDALYEYYEDDIARLPRGVYLTRNPTIRCMSYLRVPGQKDIRLITHAISEGHFETAEILFNAGLNKINRIIAENHDVDAFKILRLIDARFFSNGRSNSVDDAFTQFIKQDVINTFTVSQLKQASTCEDLSKEIKDFLTGRLAKIPTTTENVFNESVKTLAEFIACKADFLIWRILGPRTDQFIKIFNALNISNEESSTFTHDGKFLDLLASNLAAKAIAKGIQWPAIKDCNSDFLCIQKLFIKTILSLPEHEDDLSWVDNINGDLSIRNYVDSINTPAFLEYLIQNHNELKDELNKDANPMLLLVRKYIEFKHPASVNNHKLESEFLLQNYYEVALCLENEIDPRDFGAQLMDINKIHSAIALKPIEAKLTAEQLKRAKGMNHSIIGSITKSVNWQTHYHSSSGCLGLEEIFKDEVAFELCNQELMADLPSNITFAKEHRAKAEFILQSNNVIKDKFRGSRYCYYTRKSLYSMNTYAFQFKFWYEYEDTQQTWTGLAKTAYNHPLCAAGYGAHCAFHFAAMCIAESKKDTLGATLILSSFSVLAIILVAHQTTGLNIFFKTQ